MTAHDHSACPGYGNQSEWTTQQATAGFGTCQQCGKTGTHLRIEPFTGDACCKSCWEAIVYGDD